MAKFSENKIPNINTDWGLDESNGLPYSGQAVQDFLKDSLKGKYGYFHYDEIGSRYMVFADQDSWKLYDSDKEKYGDLLLTVFDAPFNYSARIELLSEAYNAVLLGSTGNTLQFKFFIENKSGDSTGENADCTITFTNGGVKKTKNYMFTSTQGREGIVIDLTDYITEGTNNINIVIKGQTNLASTSVSVVYQVVNLQLSDTFDLSKVYNVGDNLTVPVTVGGYGSKTLEWYLDGVLLPFDQSIDQINSPITITNTKTISLENIDPGVHSLQCRVYTIVEGKQFYSQTLFRNFFVKGGNETLIGIATELPIGIDPVNEVLLSNIYGITQYVPYNLRYAIYNPANLSSNNVYVYLNSELYTTTNIANGSESSLSLILNEYGNKNIKISVNGSIYPTIANVTKSSIDIYEITSNLSLDLRAFNRKNDSADESKNAVWEYKNIKSKFSGFYWNAQSGWVNNSLIVNSGATLEIEHAPFAQNPIETGKTLEFEFATRNVIDDSSVVLDLTTESGVGLLITASEVKLTASDGSVVSTKFKSGEYNRVSFVINKNENDTNACLMFIYVNGIICGASNFAKAANIRCGKNIIINSDVDVILKQLRFYNRALNSDEILNNYILYRDDVSEMLDIYSKNDIYDAMSEIDPEKIVNYLPVMYFTCLEDSKNTILGGIPALEARTDSDAKDEEIYCAINYINAQDPTLNFSIDRARVRLQGTSSIKYPKKNWRFYTATKYGTMLDHKGNVIPDGKYSFKHGSIPTDRWCLKTDYAESSSSHNTGTARIWNDLLTKASVTYSNPEKSSYYMLKGIKEDGSEIDIYTFYDKENEKLDEVAVIEQKFVTYTYVPVTRAFVIETGLSSKATPAASIPDDSDNGFRSSLFIMLPDKNGVVGQPALMTNAQKLAKENNYEYDVRTCIDGFPIVVFYRLTENDPWIFLGKHNFNNEKSSENVFGFKKIPGFDKTIIPGSVTEDNPNGYTYGEKMQCWELTNNNHEFGLFTTTEGFYDTVLDDGKQIYRWELAFEARYPDADDKTPDPTDLKRFADWLINTSQEDFAEQKWDHLDVYKMAAYYIYLMRFGAADQVVKNSMFTSEDGEHWYFINYDNDTILGVKNDGRLVFDPTIDRQTPDPDFPDAFAYAGHESRMWNMLEADKEFMDVVKAVDSALGSAGMTYEAMIDMFENKQTKQWCERIYNRDAQLKYINPYNTGVYSEGLFSLQGTRNSHRRWWLSQRFNIYDAKFITGSFKTQNIWFKLNGAPIGSTFEITSGKNLPYGYEITNGASEVTDFIPVDTDHTFVIPQGVSVGDPVLIYGATNIKKLNLSNIVRYLSQISLAGAYSDSIGSMLEEIDMSGNNVASNVTISGLEYLSSLKKLNVRGIKGIKELNLTGSLGFETLLAQDTGLSSVNLAPGCLIKTLELPDDIQTLNFIDLPLLTESGLIINNGWRNVSDIKISNCPGLTSNFNMIWDWYNNTKHIEVRNVELEGVNWTEVPIDHLIELKQKTNILLKGVIKLAYVNQEEKQKLKILRELYGNSIFNKESDLYIWGPTEVYLFGPESIYEGESAQLEALILTDEPGTLIFTKISGDKPDVEINETGLVTSIENGTETSNFEFRAVYILTDGGRKMNSHFMTINKRIYPQQVSITGPNRIIEDTGVYTWISSTEGITGKYTAEWILEGDILSFAKIESQTSLQCIVRRTATPDNLATGKLTLVLRKERDGSLLANVSMNLNIVNPNVIMTSETNPEIMRILYSTGKISSPNYLLKNEAKLFRSSDFATSNHTSIFSSNQNITNFDEFVYFTGVTEIPAYCFANTRLGSIKLPNSITRIESNAFASSQLKNMYLTQFVTFVHKSAFDFCSMLSEITVDSLNPIYTSEDGCLYENYLDILYMIPPAKQEYVMPEQTVSVSSSAEEVWKVARGLKKIVFNNKIQNITGSWFLYGFNDLTEIVGPTDHPNYTFYNGCVYNKDCTKLIYWPDHKLYDESLLHENVFSFENRSFIQNKTFDEFIIPNKITYLGEWAFYNTTMRSVKIHSGVTFVGTRCFLANANLNIVIMESLALSEACFMQCSSLQNVTLPEGLSFIPRSAFESCRSLEINIPNSITRIEDSAFKGCSLLEEIIIPENVLFIGNDVFSECSHLSTIYSYPMIAPQITQTSFGTGNNSSGTSAANKQLIVKNGSTGYESGYWTDVINKYTIKYTL